MARGPDVALIAAPSLFLAGWIVLAFVRPGTIADWQLAHALLFAGAILYLPAILRLRAIVRAVGSPRSADIGAVTALFGLCFMYGQLAIDLAVGEMVTERSELGDAFREITAEPPMSMAFYAVGPTLMFLGLAVLAVALATSRTADARAGIVVALGVVVLGASRMAGAPELTVASYAAIALGLGAIGVGSLVPGGAPKASGDQGSARSSALQE